MQELQESSLHNDQIVESVQTNFLICTYVFNPFVPIKVLIVE